jgi:hypothetical protein
MSFFKHLQECSDQEALTLLEARFKANTTFFNTHLPHLGELLAQKTKTFHLYLDTHGLNIKSNTGEFIYPIIDNKSTIYSASQALTLNLGSSATSELFFNQTGVTDYHVPTLPIICKTVNAINQHIRKDPNYTNESIYLTNEKMLPTLTMYGLLSGLQLEILMHQYERMHALFIYEPNVDFFILSAFFVDYAALYQKVEENSCFIFVGGMVSDSAVKAFFSTRLITNNYYRLEVSCYNDKRFDDAKALFLKHQRANTRGWGTVDDELFGVNNKNININPKDIKIPILCSPTKVNLPICVIGNGPSVENLLPFIAKNRDKMILMCAGTALKPLRSYGIKPDFQIEIERRDHVADVLRNAPLEDIPLICADIIHPTTLEVAKEKYIFIRDSTAATQMYSPKFSTKFSNPVVGNAALSLALEFSSEIFLCGMDVGFKSDGKQHASNSFYDDRDDKSVEKFPTRGNFSNNVYTNALFALSRELYEHAISAKKGATVYNLSDGAYISGAIPKHAHTITFEKVDKPKEIQKFKASFKTKGVFNAQNIDYHDELTTYLSEMHKLLRMRKITSKTALYQSIDSAYLATTLVRRGEPVIGTLLSGTYWHILNTLFVGLMHIHRNDIDTLYKEIITTIEHVLDEELIQKRQF